MCPFIVLCTSRSACRNPFRPGCAACAIDFRRISRALRAVQNGSARSAFGASRVHLSLSCFYYGRADTGSSESSSAPSALQLVNVRPVHVSVENTSGFAVWSIRTIRAIQAGPSNWEKCKLRRAVVDERRKARLLLAVSRLQCGETPGREGCTALRGLCHVLRASRPAR